MIRSCEINSANANYIASASDAHPTAVKLMAFQELPAGWHYGQGSAPSASLLESVRALHAEALSRGLYETDVFPGVDGEVLLAIYRGKSCMELTACVDGSFSWILEEGNEEVAAEDGLSFDRAKTSIGVFASSFTERDLRDRRWNSFDFSILSIMTEDKESLRVSPSSHPVGTVESPSSAAIASAK